MLCLVSKIMNTINIMCEAPSLKGNTSTTSVANLNHPSPCPSLGSTSSLGSAPPAGGMNKYPGVLVSQELDGVWVGDDFRSNLTLRPRNLGSWKFGCGSNLQPSNNSIHPTPYSPSRPTPLTPQIHAKTSFTSSPTPVTTVTPTPATNRIKTATGGIRKVPKGTIETPSTESNYVCDGIDCSFITNSQYEFFKDQSLPHNWKPGSQNWCFAQAKALALGRKSNGLKVSGPTVFQSTDIRAKLGKLPPNIICEKNDSPLSTSATIATISPVTTPNPSTHDSTNVILPSHPETFLPLPIKCTPKNKVKPTLGKRSFLNVVMDKEACSSVPLNSTLTSQILDGVLYFPLSYFLWKRKLPPPTPAPILPPWCMFPQPRRKKVTSSSHLKWDRRLHNQSVYCWGVNDPAMRYSSHPVTIKHGVGVPRFKENGTWAHYSHLLIPKTHSQQKHYNSNFHPSNHSLKPRGRVPRPKSGSNTLNKGHGLSKVDRIKGVGKTIPSEVPCWKKTSTPPSCSATLNTTTALNTTSTTNTYFTTSTKPQHVPYPMERTKWTRPLGGTLKGGGPTEAITIKLYGSIPCTTNEDTRKLTITCMDSVIVCPLSLIEHHSTLICNLLQETGSCM